MQIVIAPDSYKDALRSTLACERIAAGLRRVQPNAEIDLCPIADGGEGFTQAITFDNPNAQSREAQTTDPLGRRITAEWAMLCDQAGDPETAIIEFASTSGLEHLLPDERDPTRTTTLSTGKLIATAIDEGATNILLGIGGSATNDGGCGIAQGLGITFYDSKGVLIKQPITGGMLKQIASIQPQDCRSYFASRRIKVACDVTNPLTGPDGAAHVYGPQKGADAAAIALLDEGLAHLARLWREQLGVDVEYLPGAGAAGGVGGGLVAMLGAELVGGAGLVLDMVGFDRRINGADLCITGEGRLDGQSLQGKAAMTVAGRCRTAGVPCVALVGSVGLGAERSLDAGLTDYRVIGPGLSTEQSIRRTAELLEAAAESLLCDLHGG